MFKRNEPSLLLKHSAGSELEITHFAGENISCIVQPMMQEFDPFENDVGKME